MRALFLATLCTGLAGRAMVGVVNWKYSRSLRVVLCLSMRENENEEMTGSFTIKILCDYNSNAIMTQHLKQTKTVLCNNLLNRVGLLRDELKSH